MMPESSPALSFTALGVIGVCAVLGCLAVWWARRRGGAAGEGPIRLLSVRSLGGKRLLALVEVEQERFLLGLTDERIACLGRLEPLREPSRLRPAAGGELP
jgi:flagellar biogenesis protein FliO